MSTVKTDVDSLSKLDKLRLFVKQTRNRVMKEALYIMLYFILWAAAFTVLVNTIPSVSTTLYYVLWVLYSISCLFGAIYRFSQYYIAFNTYLSASDKLTEYLD